MASTYTLTESKSFTLTEARYLASKIAADLQLIQAFYGNPSNEQITNYENEAAILLSKGYLKSVEYGFKKNDEVIFTLKYNSRPDNTLQSIDDRPGKIQAGLKLENGNFYSYLEFKDQFHRLSDSEKQAIKKQLPIQRTSGEEPSFSLTGYWEISHHYSKNGECVERKIFKQAVTA